MGRSSPEEGISGTGGKVPCGRLPCNDIPPMGRFETRQATLVEGHPVRFFRTFRGMTGVRDGVCMTKEESMKTRLVTGATGLVGSNICQLIDKKEYKVRALVRSKADTEPLVAAGAELCIGDIGGVAVFLASGASSCITGATIPVDGGVANVTPVRYSR